VDIETERRTIGLEDGRRVEILAAGPPEGLPLVWHDGTPGGLVAYPPMIEAASVRGLRTILYSRPGYGGSAPRPGRTVADVAGDVAAILDALGAETFLTAGASGGGPHALACAALLPGRCLAAASLAGVAPRTADGLDWLAGMGPENIEEFAAAESGREALTDFLTKAADGLAGITGAQIAAGLGDLISAVDRAVLTGDYADYLAASFRAALSSGIAGWHDDDLAFAGDWGFWFPAAAPLSAATLVRAGEPRVPVAIWQGDQDRMVPFAHGQWLARHVPGARAHLLRGEGHLSLVRHLYGEILDDLLHLAGIAA
jgi:pimeloyl-ACP methyl ester carboxylesterase